MNEMLTIYITAQFRRHKYTCLTLPIHHSSLAYQLICYQPAYVLNQRLINPFVLMRVRVWCTYIQYICIQVILLLICQQANSKYVC